MTDPAQPSPDAAPPTPSTVSTPPPSTVLPPANGVSRRKLSSPAAFAGTVVIATLVVIACVLGVIMSGIFNFRSTSDKAASDASGPPAFVAPSARPAVDRMSDGVWIVRQDVQPGTYASTVPADSSGCSWQRSGSTAGAAGALVESGVAKANEKIVIVIQVTDTAFSSQGCGIWARTGE